MVIHDEQNRRDAIRTPDWTGLSWLLLRDSSGNKFNVLGKALDAVDEHNAAEDAPLRKRKFGILN